MKQTIGLALALVGWTGLMSLVPLEQGVGAQAPSFLASHYSSGPASVTISTRTGQVLSVLTVPSEIELSIHLIKGESTQPNDKTGTLTFSGDVSIRTRPRSELVDGPVRDQMMKAPLRLDVQDALVVVLRDKK
jgi:hypothetical protein